VVPCLAGSRKTSKTVQTAELFASKYKELSLLSVRSCFIITVYYCGIRYSICIQLNLSTPVILWIYPPQIAIVLKLGIFASFDPCNNIVKVKENRGTGTHSFPATTF